MESKIKSVVLRVARVLDEKNPGWWKRGRFDLRRFNLDLPDRCVLGQAYPGGFVAGINDVAIGFWAAVVKYARKPTIHVLAGREAEPTWRELIRERRRRAA
jgi:hypothetical protein